MFIIISNKYMIRTLDKSEGEISRVHFHLFLFLIRFLIKKKFTIHN